MKKVVLIYPQFPDSVSHLLWVPDDLASALVRSSAAVPLDPSDLVELSGPVLANDTPTWVTVFEAPFGFSRDVLVPLAVLAAQPSGLAECFDRPLIGGGVPNLAIFDDLLGGFINDDFLGGSFVLGQS